MNFLIKDVKKDFTSFNLNQVECKLNHRIIAGRSIIHGGLGLPGGDRGPGVTGGGLVEPEQTRRALGPGYWPR